MTSMIMAGEMSASTVGARYIFVSPQGVSPVVVVCVAPVVCALEVLFTDRLAQSYICRFVWASIYVHTKLLHCRG